MGRAPNKQIQGPGARVENNTIGQATGADEESDWRRV